LGRAGAEIWEFFMKKLIAVLIMSLMGLALPAAAQDEHVLRVASRGDALTLDPYAQAEGPTFNLLNQMYETLAAFGQDLSLEPVLATSWEVMEPTRWRFHLREGVHFHDGGAFTSDDVVFSIERAQQQASDYRPYVTHIVEVIPVDELTVDVVTDQPMPLLPRDITNILIMSRAWCEEHNATQVQDFSAGDENYAVRHADGTGPFKLETREQDIQTVMVRNPDWWGFAEGNTNNVDRLIFLSISNDATRIAALLSGEVDFVTDPPLQDLRRIERTPGFHLEEVPQVRTIFLGMEQAAPELQTSNVHGRNPFADERVRRAMYMALDMDAVQARIMRGRSRPAGMLIAPGIDGWDEELDTRLPFDPEAARQLMIDAGYEDGFSVRLDCPNNRYVNDEAVCQAIVAMLARIGIEVTLEALPKTLHFPKIEEGRSDFYMLGWTPGTLDSTDVFSYLYATTAIWNKGHYSNPEADELIAQIMTEFDPEVRAQMVHAVWSIVTADIAYLPLHDQVLVWAMRDRVATPITANNNFQAQWVTLDAGE